MTGIKWIGFAILLSLSPFVRAEVTCDTPLGSLGSQEFKPWIKQIVEESCAQKTLEAYPTLAIKNVIGDVNATLQAYQGAIKSFLALLNDGDFDSGIVSKIQALDLKADVPFEEFEPTYFALSVPIETTPSDIKGTLQINNSNIESYRNYVEHCVSPAPDAACRTWEKTVRLIGAMKYLTSQYSQPIVDTQLTLYAKALDSSIQKWDSYFELRKPQLPWEMAFNQAWNRDVRSADFFADPPSGDWVIMHPSLIYSRVGGAPAGEQDETALAMELIGYNWWQEKSLSGASLVAINTDRAGLDDIAYGVMLHIKNNYSVGWSYHDGNNGWFVSIDLLKAVDDKRNQLRAKEAELLARIKELKTKFEATGN